MHEKEKDILTDVAFAVVCSDGLCKTRVDEHVLVE